MKNYSLAIPVKEIIATLKKRRKTKLIISLLSSKKYVITSTNILQKPCFPDLNPFLYFYNNTVGEKEPHIGIPVGFSGARMG